MDERRKHSRFGVRIPAAIYLKNRPGEVYDAEILDISQGGAFVHCIAPIMIGQEITLEIRFSEVKHLDGKVIPREELPEPLVEETTEDSVVRWSRGSSTSGIGVEFVNLKPESRHFIDKLVQYFEKLRKAGARF